MKIKSYLFLFPLLFISVSFSQNNHEQLSSRIDSVFANKFFESTLMGIDVYDLTAKENLYSKNENLLFRPASNLKILTTSAGLVFLGPDYKFKTSLYYTGKILNGTLYGDLFVVGGCDPDFSSKDIDSLAAIIKANGLHEVTGNLFGDVSMIDSLFWGNGWMWDDDPSTDAPNLTSLNINTNSVGVVVKPSSIGEKAIVKLIPQSNFFKIENNTITVPVDSPNTFTLDRDWIHRKNTLIIRGNVSAKVIPDSLHDTLYVNVYEPQKYFLTLFEDALNNENIKIDGEKYFTKVPNYAVNIFNYERPYKNVIINLNKISYNLGAEMVLRALSAKYFGTPASAANGVKMIDSLLILAGLNPTEYRIVDGSGVSHYNLISAKLIMSLLKYMYYQKPDLYKILYQSFPIAGVDGTLKSRMTGTPAQNNVHAKTGTLSGVCSLSGYVTASNGHLIAFSMLVQNYVGSSKTGREFQDEICNILANYNGGN
ncbi:MAG: D-alanyl-D-alanine carboxypeptidase/D-alanyl-D-alanine-endopeptidase [Bacteroidetes bacterium]|nr:D-alanyl-D-alanine carboxypeptidase/D-alanyl-D-alanine-endopeptidase [Bacteroidota bacterium]